MAQGLMRGRKAVRSKARRGVAVGKPALRSEALEDRALLSAIEVTTLSDVVNGSDGLISLREAIIAANNDQIVDSSANAQLAGNGADVITFDPSLFLSGDKELHLTQYSTTEAGNSALVISTNITIQGPDRENGLTILRPGETDAFRLFEVTSAGNLTLERLTLTGGFAVGGSGGDGSMGGGGGAGLGGAIFSRGTLTVIRSTLSGNLAVGGDGGASNFDYIGGGGGGGMSGGGETTMIENGGDGGGVNGGYGGTVTEPTPTNGLFGGGGGGGYINSGGAHGHFGGGGGGAGYSEFNSISGGNGGFGGGAGSGIGAQSGAFGGASSDNGGGGGAGLGGAIFATGGTLNILSSTIAQNSVNSGSAGGSGASPGQAVGGNIFFYDGVELNVFLSTIADGIGAGDNGLYVQLEQTDLEMNLIQNIFEGSDFNDVSIHSSGGEITGSLGDPLLFNVIEDGVYLGGSVDNVLNQIGVDPVLGPLGSNGGPTKTYPLGVGSAAIDGGHPAIEDFLAAVSGGVDQRGFSDRPTGAITDAGAYEYDAQPGYVAPYGSPETMIISGASSGGESFTVPAGKNRLLVVAISDSNPTGSGVSSVTFDGTPLTLEISQTISGARTSFYYLPLGDSTVPTTETVIVGWDDNVNASVTMAAYYGVDQDNPIASSINDFDLTVSLDVDSNDLHLSLAAEEWSEGGLTPASTQEAVHTVDNVGGSYLDSSFSQRTGEGTVFFTVNSTSGNSPAHIAMSLKHASNVVPDTTAPTVTSITRYSPTAAYTDSNELVFEVTFDEGVSNVTDTDFVLSGAGTQNGGAVIDSVSEVPGTAVPGSVYRVTVIRSGSVQGEINLDFASGNDIVDASDNAFAGTVASEEVYNVDLSAPEFSAYLDSALVSDVKFLVSMDELGTAYYVIVPANDSAPTEAEIIAGTGAGGSTVVTSGSISIELTVTDILVTASGLTELTDYVAYSVGVDQASKPSAIASFAFTTKTIETEVTYEDGFIVITDVNGGNSSDKYAITHANGYFVISDLHADDADATPFGTSLSESTGNGTYQLRVTSEGVTGLRVRSLAGTDEILIEGSLPTLSSGIDIDLGAGDDTLTLQTSDLNGGAGGITLTSDIMHVGGSLTVTGAGAISAIAGHAMAFSANVSTGAGGATFTSAKGIHITGTQTFAASDDGTIVFTSNLLSTGVESFNGIWVDQATISLTDGTAAFTGYGGAADAETGSHGVRVNASTLTATGEASWSFMGGAHPSVIADGVRIEENSEVSVDDGSVNIEGYSSLRHGLAIANSKLPAGGGTVTLYGESGGETAVLLDAPSTGIIDSSGGDVTITGVSLDGSAIVLTGTSEITTEKGANIVMTGTSSGTGSASGVEILGYVHTDNGNISISGTSGGTSDALGLYVEGSVFTTNGTIALSGTTNGGVGLQLDGAYMPLHSGNDVTLYGNATSGVGVKMLGDMYLVTDGGHLEITASSIDLLPMSLNQPLVASKLTFKPVDPAASIGVGSGAGSLQLNHEELKRLPLATVAMSEIIFGDATNGTGRVEIGDAVFSKPIVVVGGEVVASNLDVSNTRATLIARTGSITQGELSDHAVGVRADEVLLRAATDVGSSSISFKVDTNEIAVTTTEGGIFIKSLSDLVIGSIADVSGAVIQDVNDDNAQNRISFKVDGTLTVNAPVTNNDEGEVLLRADEANAKNANSALVGHSLEAGSLPFNAAVSPDGLHVYVASFTAATLTILGRDPDDGTLTFIDDLDAQDSGLDGLNGTYDVEVSADGAFVYVAGASADSVVVFSRDAQTGALTLIETQTNGLNGVIGMPFPFSVSLSPAGDFLYVLSGGTHVVTFSRDDVTGALTYADSLDLTATDAGGAFSLVLSPDGEHAYSVNLNTNSLSVLDRDSVTGALTVIDTLVDDENGIESLHGVAQVAVSPDGLHVYVTSAEDDALTVFGRNATTGLLTLLQVNREVGSSPFALTISPDGHQVWAGSSDHNAVKIFDRDVVTGTLELVDQISLNGTGHQVGVLAFAPDNNHVYAPHPSSNALSIFSRDLVSETINELPNPALGEAGDLIINDEVTSPNGTIKLFAADDVTLPDGAFERLTSIVEIRAGRDSNDGVIHQDQEGVDVVDLRAKSLLVSTAGPLDLVRLVATEVLKARSTNSRIFGYGDFPSVQAETAVFEAFSGVRGGLNGLDVLATEVAAVTEEGDIRLVLSSPNGPAVIGTVEGIGGTINGITITDAADDNQEEDDILIQANGGLIVNQPITNNDEYRIYVNVDDGDVVLNAPVSAISDRIDIYSDGKIIDGTATALDLIAARLVLSAYGGIGATNNPLETQVSVLGAIDYFSDVAIANTGDLTLESFIEAPALAILSDEGLGTGDIRVSTTGTFGINAFVAHVATGEIVLSSTGAMTVDNSIFGSEVTTSISLITADTLTINNVVGSLNPIGDITVVANDLVLNTETGEVTATGDLTIKPYDPTANIGIGTTEGDLTLIGVELARISDGFSLITIGDAEDGSGTIRAGEVSFNDPLTLAAPAEGGVIQIFSDLTLNGAGDALTLTSPTINLDGSAVTRGGVVTLDGHVQVDSFGIVTTNNEADGGDVSVTNGIDGAGSMTINAGTGNVSLNGGIGQAVVMTALSIASADDVLINSPRFDLNDLPINITATGVVSYVGEISWANPDPDSTRTSYRLIENLGSQTTAGIFSDLPTGATITFPGFTGHLNYVGGDGNDFLLMTDTISVRGGEEDDHFVVVLNDRDSDLLQVYLNDVLMSEVDKVDVANLTLRGLAGNDRLTTDFSEGFFTVPVNFDGGVDTTGDKLDFVNSMMQSVGYSFDSPTAGSIHSAANAGNQTVSYSNAEQLTDIRFAMSRAFTFNGGSEEIVLNDAGTAGMRIDSTQGSQLDFALPINSIVINAGSGNDTVTAPSFDSSFLNSLTINGDDGSDVIDASAINRPLTINGGLGHDTLTGSLANDTINGDGGNDVINGHRGNDSLVGGAGNDVAMGSLGNDVILGGRGVDTLTGGSGDDGFQWVIGDGNDIVDGNLGNDSFRMIATDVSQTGDNITVSDLNDRALIVAQSNGTAAGYTLNVGTTESLIFELLNGNDLLDASSLTVASITATGGRGNDTIRGGSQADALIGGNDLDSLLGNGGDDALLGGADADTLEGGQGNDRLRGQGGDGDQLWGGMGNDDIDGGEGDDFVVEWADQNFTLSDTELSGDITGTDTLISIENAKLTGDSSANAFDASAFTGRAIIYGGSGNDTITGGSGNDALIGEDGDDQIDGGDGNDVIRGGAGNDSQLGGNGNDMLYGGGGRDTLLGNDGNDHLFGQGGSLDDLQGGAGNDTLNGGSGNDFVNGGDDDDHIVWNNLDGNDAITGGNGTDELVVNASDEAAEGDNITVQDSAGKVVVRRTAGTLVTGFALSVTGVETIVINAYAGNDHINAAALTLANVRLNGGLGNDTLSGGSNSDTLHGNAGSDSLNGGGSADTIDTRADETGTDGTDTINTDVLDTVFKDLDDVQI